MRNFRRVMQDRVARRMAFQGQLKFNPLFKEERNAERPGKENHSRQRSVYRGIRARALAEIEQRRLGYL